MYGWPEVADTLKKAYAEAGFHAAMRRAADLETAKYGTMPGVANDAATNYLMAGDAARAFEWFEKAYAVRDPNLPYLSGTTGLVARPDREERLDLVDAARGGPPGPLVPAP